MSETPLDPESPDVFHNKPSQERQDEADRAENEELAEYERYTRGDNANGEDGTAAAETDPPTDVDLADEATDLPAHIDLIAEASDPPAESELPSETDMAEPRPDVEGGAGAPASGQELNTEVQDSNNLQALQPIGDNANGEDGTAAAETDPPTDVDLADEATDLPAHIDLIAEASDPPAGQRTAEQIKGDALEKLIDDWRAADPSKVFLGSWNSKGLDYAYWDTTREKVVIIDAKNLGREDKPGYVGDVSAFAPKNLATNMDKLDNVVQANAELSQERKDQVFEAIQNWDVEYYVIGGEHTRMTDYSSEELAADGFGRLYTDPETGSLRFEMVPRGDGPQRT